MTQQQYLVNTRQLTTFAPLSDELVYDPTKNYLFDLSYLAGIHVTGERAAEFLQGQLSCDVRDVNDHQMRQGALCNLKGRILALLDIVNWHEYGFQLILPNDLLSATQASLTKTALLSRVVLNPASDYQLFGFYLQNHDDIRPFNVECSNTHYGVIHHAEYCCYCLGNNLYIFLVQNKDVNTLRNLFIAHSQWRGSLAWHALQLLHKSIQIYPNSRGLLLPHRVDLHLSSYLSFNKGCYKGQEIIARTHYRAQLKHVLKVFTIQTDGTLTSGQRLLNENGKQEIGELIDYCPVGNGKFIISASVIFEHPTRVIIDGLNQIVELMLLN